MAISTILKGANTPTLNLKVSGDYDCTGATLTLSFNGFTRVFSNFTAQDTLNFSFSAAETAQMPLGTNRATLSLKCADGTIYELPWVKIKVTDSPEAITEAIGTSVYLTKVFPAEKNEETGEYEVSVKSVFKNKVTIEPGTGDETAEEETSDSVGIAAFDNSVERGLEVFDESAAISSKLVPDGTAFATCGAIREVAYKFPTFSSSDTVNTIITKLQQIITLLQEIGD